MIVTTASASAMTVVGPGSERTRVSCLARRDLVAADCESFEHLRLSPGGTHHRAGRPETEAAWYVLRGPVVAEQRPDRAQHLADAGDLLLVPAGQDLDLQAGPLGAELLCLTLGARPAPRRRPLPRRRTRP
ncbi:quercetin dioxygenase-like cupin family protein [Kitasatospora gansuensis]|uniref:Quercetin dioxygenase-like cupin family protein n=1 Tax=Kitasatospora gansuensis TaxID=258050 RepID=A0A7W7WGB8_9ACTN|nr:hypothetical protein [Kitasatospora gansuensis]MBB4945853.1 quercetin dioxygenase-like cupin family protein [Kitasatospora gansuensis]